MPLLSIVFSFRNRDIQRVQRCLESLQAQTFTDFEVLFVDYGSDKLVADAIAKTVEQFSFCEYIYTETRGYPWNRSKALNIAIRRARGDYIITTDIDMIFTDQFLEVVAQLVSPTRLIQNQWEFLPEGFDDWKNLDQYIGTLSKSNQLYGHGGFICADRQVQQKLRGFDEVYRYYGREDVDMTQRLQASGLEPYWIEAEHVTMFHQWHSTHGNDLSRQLSPPSQRANDLWNLVRLSIFEYYHRVSDTLIRNDETWGQCLSSADRVVTQFVDLDSGAFQQTEDVIEFSTYPYHRRSASDFLDKFMSLNTGETLAVAGANLPERRASISWVLHNMNRILRTVGIDTYLDYRDNTLHQFIHYFIMMQEGQLVRDYYVDTQNHYTLLVRG